MRAVWRFIRLTSLPGYLLDDQFDRALVESVPPMEQASGKESGFLNNLSSKPTRIKKPALISYRLREKAMSTKTERKKAAQNRIKAMNHPVRAALLGILAERTSSPAEMARELDEDLSNVSYHTKQLVELECAELVSTRPVRGALEHFYRATERSVMDKEGWDGIDPMMAETLIHEVMQKILDNFVAAAEAKTIGDNADFHLTRTPLLLDQRGLQEALEAHERTRHELLEIASRSAERMVESSEEGINVSSSQACFKIPNPKGRQTS